MNVVRRVEQVKTIYEKVEGPFEIVMTERELQIIGYSGWIVARCEDMSLAQFIKRELNKGD